MVGPVRRLTRVGKLTLDRRLDLFAQMVYELRYGLEPDLAERAAGNSHRTVAVGHGLRVKVETMLVEYFSSPVPRA